MFTLSISPTPESSTLSLHDALPICGEDLGFEHVLSDPDEDRASEPLGNHEGRDRRDQDRKSTRLNSSHVEISYAVFCLKKKKVADVAIIAIAVTIVAWPMSFTLSKR